MNDLLQKIGVNINVTFSLIFLSLIWVRILAMTAMIPFLFGKPVPRYVTIGASMVLALFAYPRLVPASPPPIADDMLLLVVMYLKEAFYGIAIGMAVSIIFHAFAAVGQMVDSQRGLSIARVLIPQLGEQGSVFGMFFYQLGIVIYLAVGGHRMFFQSFFEGFNVLPILGFPVTGPGFFPLIDLFIRITAEVLVISIQMSAPVIIAIFFVDVILGIANRVSPQINVWILGFQLKGYLGVLMVFVAITMIGDQMARYTLGTSRYTDQVILFLQGRVPVTPLEVPPPEGGLIQPEGGAPKVKTVE